MVCPRYPLQVVDASRPSGCIYKLSATIGRRHRFFWVSVGSFLHPLHAWLSPVSCSVFCSDLACKVSTPVSCSVFCSDLACKVSTRLVPVLFSVQTLHARSLLDCFRFRFLFGQTHRSAPTGFRR